MSQVQSFTIGDTTYNAAMASAVKQDELLSILTGAIMERGLAAAREGQELTDEVLAPMFMAMPTAGKTRVAAILMGQVFVNGTQIPVTIEDFSGRMVQYNQLLAQLLRFNLSDFFVWLPSVLASVRQPTTPADVTV